MSSYATHQLASQPKYRMEFHEAIWSVDELVPRDEKAGTQEISRYENPIASNHLNGKGGSRSKHEIETQAHTFGSVDILNILVGGGERTKRVGTKLYRGTDLFDREKAPKSQSVNVETGRRIAGKKKKERQRQLNK